MEIYDPATGKCGCDKGAERNSNGFCCPEGAIYDDNGFCMCDDEHSYQKYDSNNNMNCECNLTDGYMTKSNYMEKYFETFDE